ncbi:hypothetical protein [Pseudomonas sp. PDM20]|uniref:hypothetical protein n=1 Tax=Pseudomonas sp. PDM20 TaxID=2769254 RepID=UPI00177FBC48|nr:hypothetical protein [Pseudomonas sp. PDM20]MBD9681072.1 hypothetical protein [Pseudomonas sp. PDM20]
MIPVPLFSMTLLILLAVSGLALLALLGGLLVFGASASARAWVRRHRVRSGVLLLVLCMLSFPSAYLARSWLMVRWEIRQEQAARHPTLAAATRIHGLDMPAGTRLSLPRGGDLQAAEEADFPSPVPIHGVATLSVRFSSDWDDEAPPGQLVHLPIVELSPSEVSTVEGWHCAAKAPLRLAIRSGTVVSLEGCVLAEGNQVDGIDISAGSQLMRYTTHYGDGLKDDDRWKIKVNTSARVAQIPLEHPSLRFDAQRKLVALNSAALSLKMTLGPMTYPAGTHVQSAGRGLRERYPGAWLFSPVNGQEVQEKGDKPIGEGMTIVQYPDGRVEGQLPNDQAGVIIFQEITSAPDEQ